MSDDKGQLPKTKSAGDYAHSGAKTLLSAIPFVGGAAAELFATVIGPSLATRRDMWLEGLAERLAVLECKGLDLAALRDNDEFIDIVMIASAAAIKTSNEKKREALRNAVINTALGRTPEESLAQIFVSLIDGFTEWHLKVLKLFENPSEWAEAHGRRFGTTVNSSIHEALVGAYPELVDRKPFYGQVWRDLYQRGLVSIDEVLVVLTPGGALEKRTTDLGDAFLRFIEAE